MGKCMKHENEIVDARVMMRIICGIFAAVGIWAFGSATLQVFSERPYDWAALVTPFASVFGIFISAWYAASGRLPPFMSKKKGSEPA